MHISTSVYEFKDCAGRTVAAHPNTTITVEVGENVSLPRLQALKGKLDALLSSELQKALILD